MRFEKEKIKKILCIKPRGIGDVILSTIVLDNLLEYFPNSTIDYLTEPYAKPALENLPQISKIHTMAKSEFFLKAALKIRKEKYDLVFDFWSNPRTAQIVFCSGIKRRVGYSYRGRRYAYNFLASPDRGSHHSAEHNLELLKPLGVPVNSTKIHYRIGKEDNEKAKSFIESKFSRSDNVIGIVPAGGWNSKRCDAVKWVEFCNEILKNYSAKFLILWGPGDEADAEFIISNLRDKAHLAPKTSLKEMSALINNCDLIIANDSGPMHISAALGIPTIGIFGPTDPKGHGPYSPNSDYIIKEDLHCIICNKLECPSLHECMRELSAELLIEKINKTAPAKFNRK